jgi:hypothetical protein
MSGLARTERQFQDHVLGAGDDIADEIAGGDEAFRALRLGIYRNAYRLRLEEVLGNDYPALRTQVGDAAFSELAQAYIATRGSGFRNVRWFGGGLPDFLHEDARFRDRATLADLARFEWALGLAFDAADAPALGFAEIAAIAPDAWSGMGFVAHPAVQLLECRTNAVAIWKAVQQGGPVPAESVQAAPESWAVWRESLAPFYAPLLEDEACAATAMLAGEDFGAICDRLCEWHDAQDVAARAAALLRGWVERGWIVELRLAG